MANKFLKAIKMMSHDFGVYQKYCTSLNMYHEANKQLSWLGKVGVLYHDMVFQLFSLVHQSSMCTIQKLGFSYLKHKVDIKRFNKEEPQIKK